jgi:hypothetical protein
LELRNTPYYSRPPHRALGVPHSHTKRLSASNRIVVQYSIMIMEKTDLEAMRLRQLDTWSGVGG